MNNAKPLKKTEDEKISQSNVAYSDPKMIEISLYEIKNFLITENIAKGFIIIGSLFLGPVISALIAKTNVNPFILIVSLAIFIPGISFDVYITYSKFKELKKKGAGKWK
jgi:hypothetical protein